MLKHSRLSVALLMLGFGALVQACGSRSPVGPTVPGAAASAGAVIQGSVAIGAGASASPAPAQSAGGIKVSVSGTAKASVTDSGGRFALSGVPTGRALELHFEGQSVDARMQIGPLTEGQNLDLHVSVSGSQAVETHGEDETEFSGSISAISASGLTVAGRSVVVDASTRIVDKGDASIALSALKLGDTVEVEGTVRADMSVLASRIKREEAQAPEPGPEPEEVEFSGSIGSIGASSLVVAGRTVVVDANTRIRDKGDVPLAFSALKVGDAVEVEGTLRADASVLASKIKREGAEQPEPEELEFSGSIGSIGASSLVVAGRTVIVDASTRIRGKDDATIPLSALKVGDKVEVEGMAQADMSVLARKIKLENHDSD